MVNDLPFNVDESFVTWNELQVFSIYVQWSSVKFVWRVYVHAKNSTHILTGQHMDSCDIMVMYMYHS